MTVSDLLESLRTRNPNAEVVIRIPDGRVCPGLEVYEGGYRTLDHGEGKFQATGSIPSEPGWVSAVLLDWIPS